MQVQNVLGMDIGGTNMRFGVVNKDLDMKNFIIKDTQQMLSCSDPVGQLVKLVREYCNEFLKGELPEVLSIGFPSTIDRERKVITNSPNIKSLQNLEIVERMQSELGTTVMINRDVNFLFLYDIAKHNLENNGIILGFYIGTGLGNAVSINGKLLVGKNGIAAELGHIPMYNHKQPCGCGNFGCAETLASGTGLEKIREKHFPETKIEDIFTKHANSEELKEFINTLVIPIAIEIAIFDPDYIIVGGGVTQMNGFPTELFEKAILSCCRKPYPAENLRILYSIHGQENGVVGAAIDAFDRIKKA